MPIQAYLDDSGEKGQGNLLLFAGLISSRERWAEFSKAWAACLSASPSLPYFKFSEADGCKGSFHCFSYQERQRKVAALARLIAEHAEAGVYCAVDLAGFEDTFATNDRPFNHPKFQAFMRAILCLCVDIYARGHTREPFEAICDDLPTQVSKLKAWYPYIRKLADLVVQPEATILPADLRFSNDNDALPLQAADMLAGVWRKRGSAVLRGARIPPPEPLIEVID